MKKYKNKTNKKAFTLIELLAVIVILGVLMITAIPAVTKAIAKSRRDTYATNAKKIIDAVRTSVLNEEFNEGADTCQLPGPNDYIVINLVPTTGTESVIDNLLERGGKQSSFNKQYKEGTIWIVNEGSETNDKYVYYITLVDSGKNGIKDAVAENSLNRSKVFIGSAAKQSATKPTAATGTAHTCTYAG